MSDKIFLRGAHFYARHGVSEHERVGGGRIVADVTLEYDLARAGSTDELADTISYADVFRVVRSLIEEERFKLLETLAHKIAATLLAQFPATAVTVQVCKQPPPLHGIVESAGVEIHRSRQP